MIRTVRHLGRMVRIARALAQADALFLAEAHPLARSGARLLTWVWPPRREMRNLRPGQRLAAALGGLGPTFIKFGQALSTRSDLLGEQVAADLAELQDRLPPFSFAKAKAQIEADFGCPVGALFSHIDPKPVAAASIAQVHFAVDSDGREVAIKVLRPEIAATFAAEIDFLDWGADIVLRAMPKLARLKPKDVVATFAETVRVEMDLRLEAAAAQELAENFKDDPGFRVPAVDWQRTAEHVMTVERVAGLRVDNRAAVEAAGLDPQAVVQGAAEAFFKMVFRDGFFHADMHPGNLFVTPSAPPHQARPGGTIIAMDFGIMGRVDFATRKHLGEMLLGFLTRDYRKVAEVHVAAGFVPAHKSVDAFAQACRSIAEPILGKPIAEISVAKLLGQLFAITETFEMQVQPQLLLLQKSMLVAEGVGRNLAPEINMWDMARPLIEDWMRSQLGPEGLITDAAVNTIDTLAKIPRIIDRIDRTTSAVERSGFRLHPDTAAAIRGQNGGARWPGWLPWAIAGLAVVALVMGAG